MIHSVRISKCSLAQEAMVLSVGHIHENKPNFLLNWSTNNGYGMNSTTLRPECLLLCIFVDRPTICAYKILICVQDGTDDTISNTVTFPVE
jgi:hypothetical protein